MARQPADRHEEIASPGPFAPAVPSRDREGAFALPPGTGVFNSAVPLLLLSRDFSRANRRTTASAQSFG